MPYIGKEPEHGNYQLLDALTLPSGVFNGSRTVFNLTTDSVAVYPTSPTTMIISLGGVIQEPNATYTVSGNQITFTTAPATSTAFFGVSLGDTLDIGTPSDGSVTVAKMAANSVDSAQYVDGSIDTVHIGNLQITNPLIADDAVGADELATNAVVNASIASGAAIDATKIADGSVTSTEFQYINTLSSNAQTQIGLKAALAAPALTGNATATTQAGTDDSTRIATTAHVKDVKIDDFTAGDDNTTLDSSTSRHGLLLKLGGGTTNFLRADGTWNAAGGAVTREGGRSGTTEGATNSTSEVDLIDVTSLTISALAPVEVIFAVRRSSGAVSGASVGLDINNASALVQPQDLFANENSGGTARSGWGHIWIGAGISNYNSSTGVMAYSSTALNDQFAYRVAEVRPTTDLTDVTLVGYCGSSSVTLAVNEMHIYSMGTSGGEVGTIP